MTAGLTFPKMIQHGTLTEAPTSKAAHLHGGTPSRPAPVNGKVQWPAPPRRVPNRERRTREHLTPTEAERLIAAAGKVGRHGHRDSTLLLSVGNSSTLRRRSPRPWPPSP
jgi:hypothetical protein